MDIKFAIVTCSDTRTIEEDTAGAALAELIRQNGWSVASHVIVKDERDEIGKAIVAACDEAGADVVLTCGGSGLSLRDVTPEATRDVCDREVPGIAEAMRAHSLKITGRAMLSRAVSGIRGKTLIVNLPGSPKAVAESLEVLLPVLGHAVETLGGNTQSCGGNYGK